MGEKSLLDHLKIEPEFKSELPYFSRFAPARHGVFQYWLQNKEYQNLPKRQIDINLENMIGYQEEKEKNCDRINEDCKEIAKMLYCNVNPCSIEIPNVSLMVSGSSLPLKVRAELRNHESIYEKNFYVKPFDEQRLLGLSLYSLIAGINDYNYLFSEDMIVEDEIRGKHKFQFDKEFLNSLFKTENFKKQRIKMDVMGVYLGVDDLGKEDNYVITDEGNVYIIDFDVMDGVYDQRYRQIIKEDACRELGIEKSEYNKIFKQEELKLIDRVRSKGDHLSKLLNILESLKGGKGESLSTTFGNLLRNIGRHIT